MAKKLLVVGGAGALGRGLMSRFTRASWAALSVDYVCVLVFVLGRLVWDKDT